MITINDFRILAQGWEWRTWEGLPYLTCSLLRDWPHGFFTRHYHPLTPEDFGKALDEKAIVYRVKQVHGTRIVLPDEIGGTTTEADGILSASPGESLWVASADCTPVLIADRGTGRVAALHAGWRGTGGGIVIGAIDRFLNSGSELDNLVICLGPAISKEVYQFSESVAAEVGKSLFPGEPRENLLGLMFALENPPVSPDPEAGKVRLDVRGVIFHQLRALGIGSERIAIAPFCTYRGEDNFFSYRRQPAKKIQWSGIVGR